MLPDMQHQNIKLIKPQGLPLSFPPIATDSQHFCAPNTSCKPAADQFIPLPILRKQLTTTNAPTSVRALYCALPYSRLTAACSIGCRAYAARPRAQPTSVYVPFCCLIRQQLCFPQLSDYNFTPLYAFQFHSMYSECLCRPMTWPLSPE